MTIRFRAGQLAAVALVCGAAVATAGCGKYSFSSLKASKNFKDANSAVRGEGLQESRRPLRRRGQARDRAPNCPSLQSRLLLPGKLLRPALQAGQAGGRRERRLIQKAIRELSQGRRQHHRRQVEEIVPRVPRGRLRLRQAQRPGQGRAGLQGNHRTRARRARQLHGARQALRGCGPLRRRRGAVRKAKAVKPNDPTVLASLAGYYNRQGDFPKTIEALEQAAALEPNNPEGYHRVAVFYWDEGARDSRLSPAEKKDFVQKGLAMEDKALEP